MGKPGGGGRRSAWDQRVTEPVPAYADAVQLHEDLLQWSRETVDADLAREAARLEYREMGESWFETGRRLTCPLYTAGEMRA